MANAFENTDLVTQETLMHVVNEMVMYGLADKQWESKFAKDGAKNGDTIRIRKPLNAGIRTGPAVAIEDLTDDLISLVLEEQIGSDFAIRSSEKTLNLDRLSERYLEPRARRLANEIDFRVARAAARDCPNFVGTPGTIPTSLQTYHDALTKLLQLGAPKSPRHIVQTPEGLQNVINDLRGLIESGPKIAGQYTSGRMTRAIGADWHMSQNLYTHTVGPLGGTPTVNGAGQSGANIITAGWTAAAALRLRRGDKITFAGSNAVNPITGSDNGVLRQFVVTADVSSDGAGAATIPISPAIVLSGPNKNVSAAPTHTGAVLIFGHASSHANRVFKMQLALHPSAIACAVVGLEKPGAGEKSWYMSDEDAGISLRFVQQYEVRTDLNIGRFDVIGGYLLQLPDFACVICQ